MNHTNKSIVLVVDDNPANIQVVGENLSRQNVEISIATNAKKAISIAKNIKPDLILLDIMMPEIDGFEVCKILKNDPETAEIPIIFLTAKVHSSDIVKGFELGAVDYVTKPFNSAELLARVNTHLSNRNYLKQIEEKKLQLEKMDTEKNEFLGIAAHDLKNPIYNVSMIAKMIRDDDSLTNDEVKEFASDLVSTADKMLELIKNLLDINKIEQGKISIEMEDYDLDILLSNTIFMYQDRAKKKNIELCYSKIGNSFFAKTDQNAFGQIFDNLISNAIKFSESGKKCFIELIELPDKISVSVKDEGPGFSEDDMKKIFGKFSRLSAQPTAGEHSTGLGLSIVKKYIDLMNAEINCESKTGKGAKFIINFKK